MHSSTQGGFRVALAVTALLLVVAGLPAEPGSADLRAPSGTAGRYGRLPLAFEANQGQVDPAVRFLARGTGYELLVKETGSVLSLHPQADRPGAAVRIAPLGAQSGARVVGVEPLAGRVNYLRTPDPTTWLTGVATYARVEQRDVYPGVDFAYYGNQGQVEYDVVVAPGRDPGVVRLGIEGALGLSLRPDGALTIDTAAGPVTQQRPAAYQAVGGTRRPVAAGYSLSAEGEVGFRVGAFDRSLSLVIDPVLVFSTYLGGSGVDGVNGLEVDPSGSAYVVGTTDSTDLQTTPGAVQAATGGATDAFVAKLNPAGTALEYVTYLGGGSDETGDDLSVDASGAVYVAGSTSSPDFPTTPGAFDTSLALEPPDGFVTKIDPGGSSLAYSSYLGQRRANIFPDFSIAVDGSGTAYVAGGALLLAEINPAGTTMTSSSLLNPPRRFSATPRSVVVGPDGAVYVSGTRAGPICGFCTPGAFQGSPQSNGDAFVAKLTPHLTALVYGTILGGPAEDFALDLAVDAAGAAYVTGVTFGGITGFPIPDPPENFFLAGMTIKLNPSGSAVDYATYLSGTATGIAVDGAGTAWVTGSGGGPDFPITPDAFDPTSENTDGFVARLDATGAVAYASFLGGAGLDRGTRIALDPAGAAYVAGTTESADFPTTPGAPDHTLGGTQDGFVAKVGEAPSTFVNLLDGDTSTIEGGLGHWVPWFSSTVAQSTAQAHGGSSSMKVDVTAPFGWGVTLDNWPGFPASPGPMYLSFAGLLGSGSDLGATMSVDWHRADGAVLRTDTVTLRTLSTTWQRAGSGVFAPPGTASITVEISDPSGVAGDSLYLDDIVVAPTTHLLDDPTATLEGSTGRWVPWFSSALSASGTAVNGGNSSLEVDVTAPFGWGIQLDDWVAFEATPGAKTIAFWARPSVGSLLGATMSVDWRDASGALLATDTLTIAEVDGQGQHVSADVVAPPGTALVSVEFSHPSGGPGDVLYLDDILVADRPVT